MIFDLFDSYHKQMSHLLMEFRNHTKISFWMNNFHIFYQVQSLVLKYHIFCHICLFFCCLCSFIFYSVSLYIKMKKHLFLWQNLLNPFHNVGCIIFLKLVLSWSHCYFAIFPKLECLLMKFPCFSNC